MSSSDYWDDIDDDSFLGHHEPFLSKHNQRDHNHQLSLFNPTPTPYDLSCFAIDQFNPDLDLILFHQQQQGEVALDLAIGGGGTEKGVAEEERVAVASGRSSKKDRHSKITTARGIRDRRMRLSLKVAREFFDLQDMLGFDKASKTVEWLISQSNSAIKEITRKVRGNDRIAASFASDCEIRFDDDNGGRTMESSSGWKRSKKERKAGQSRRRDRPQISSSATRESRMKARKRARERTIENMWKRSLEGSSLNNPMKPCSSPHVVGEESSCIQDQTATTGSNLVNLTQYKEIARKAGRIRIDFSSSDLVGGKWSPATASSSNLDLQELGIPQSQQLRNCEQFFKQWEAYYNYGFDHS